MRWAVIGLLGIVSCGGAKRRDVGQQWGRPNTLRPTVKACPKGTVEVSVDEGGCSVRICSPEQDSLATEWKALEREVQLNGPRSERAVQLEGRVRMLASSGSHERDPMLAESECSAMAASKTRTTRSFLVKTAGGIFDTYSVQVLTKGRYRKGDKWEPMPADGLSDYTTHVFCVLDTEGKPLFMAEKYLRECELVLLEDPCPGCLRDGDPCPSKNPKKPSR